VEDLTKREQWVVHLEKRKEELSSARASLRRVQSLEEVDVSKSREEGGEQSALIADTPRIASQDIIKPIYDPQWLTTFIEGSSELKQVIHAMVSNTVGFGHRTVPRIRKKEQTNVDDVLDEAIKLENFFRYVNAEQDLTELLTEAVWDYYLTGNMYFEVSRNDTTGQPDGLIRVPSHQMEIMKLEEEPYANKIKRIERTRDGYKVSEREEAFRRRRYVQTSTGSSRTGSASNDSTHQTFYKAFQDDRAYDRDTGKLVKEKSKISELKSKNKLAREIIHVAEPRTRGPYGFVRHIGNVISIVGDQKAEEINYATIKNNSIPSMFVMVSGGNLTQDSIDRLKDFIQVKINNSDNRSKFVLLESEPMTMDDVDIGNAKIEVKSLHDTRINDAMFTEYSTENRQAQRRAYRLPEVLVGRGDAKTRAEVEANVKFADEQIFAIDRDKFVKFINNKLFAEMGIVHNVIELNTPNVTDTQALVQAMRDAEKTGAMTPEIARMIMERLFGQDLPEFPQGFDSTLPFSLLMAEAIKNQADPTEPTQQVTSEPQN